MTLSFLICFFVQRAAIRQFPFQWFKVTILGSQDARHFFIPWTSICPGPLQQFKVTIRGSTGSRHSIARNTKLSQVFHHLEMSIERWIRLENLFNIVFVQRIIQYLVYSIYRLLDLHTNNPDIL